MKKLFFSLIMCGTILASTLTASAKSSSRTDYSSALSASITSNCWIQTFSDLDGGGDFQVSAEYRSNNSEFSNPEWIQTKWSFYSVGIGAGVSISGGSGSIGGYGSSSNSGYWRNSNGARTASWRGRVYATGLSLYTGVTNEATAFKAGVTLSTTSKL